MVRQPSNLPLPAITGAILAGGQGSRMGGVDKGLVTLEGKPMAAWALARLAPQVDEVLINANRNAEAYAALGYPVFGDDIPGQPGPLAGLHAALLQARHPLVATAPCDSPFLPTDLVARLAAALLATQADLAVARSEGRSQPVFCLCRRELAGSLRAFLDGGGRKVSQWHAAVEAVEVDFDDVAAAFRNINTMEELAAASRPPAP